MGFELVSVGGFGLGFSGSLFYIEDVATDSIITIGGGPGTRDVRLENFFWVVYWFVCMLFASFRSIFEEFDR